MLWSLLPVSAPVRRLTFGTFLRFPTRFSGIRFELSRRTARHERTLEAVACKRLFGQDFASHAALLLQLLLQRSEEAPVGPLGHDLLRGRFDHPDLVQA